MDGRPKRARTQFKRHARIPRHPARTVHKARVHTNRKAETTTASTRATTKKEATTEPDLGTPQVKPREQPLPAEAHQFNSVQPRPPPRGPKRTEVRPRGTKQMPNQTGKNTAQAPRANNHSPARTTHRTRVHTNRKPEAAATGTRAITQQRQHPNQTPTHHTRNSKTAAARTSPHQARTQLPKWLTSTRLVPHLTPPTLPARTHHNHQA